VKNTCVASQQLPNSLQLLKNNRSDEKRVKNVQPSNQTLIDAGSPIEYLKRFKQQKKQQTLAYEDKLVDDTVIVDEKKNDLEETTPSSFRQTVFNPEQNPKTILKQEPATVHQGSLSHLKIVRTNSQSRDTSNY